MKRFGISLLTALTIVTLLPTGTPAADPQTMSLASTDQLKSLEGQWFGTWRSSRGNVGMFSAKIQLESSTNHLRATFTEESIRNSSSWEAIGQVNDKGELIFVGPERVETLRLDSNGKLIGTYQWKTKPSHGDLELTKK